MSEHIYECWAWVEDTGDGAEGLIAAAVPKLEHLGLIPLTSRNRSIVVGWEGIVRDREAASGFPARMVHLVEEDPKAMGTADWMWDDELGCHIPCCSRPKGRWRCGNGPLNQSQIAAGDCGESHEA